jgi:hypothetical protein
MMAPEPLPLSEADTENIQAVLIMLGMARGRIAAKREPFYRAAGQHLDMLRRGKLVEHWAEICRTHIGIGLSRAYELVAIGAGRQRLAGLRAQKGAQTKRWKAANQHRKRNSEIESGA